MKYAVEMGSGAMIYVPSFIKFGSAVQNLIGVDSIIILDYTMIMFMLI
jgi:hypothetical protein